MFCFDVGIDCHERKDCGKRIPVKPESVVAISSVEPIAGIVLVEPEKTERPMWRKSHGRESPPLRKNQSFLSHTLSSAPVTSSSNFLCRGMQEQAFEYPPIPVPAVKHLMETSRISVVQERPMLTGKSRYS